MKFYENKTPYLYKYILTLGLLFIELKNNLIRKTRNNIIRINKRKALKSKRLRKYIYLETG